MIPHSPLLADLYQLTMAAGYWAAKRELFDSGIKVPMIIRWPEAFRPAPKVDSAIVRLLPLRPLPFAAHDEATFARVVAAAVRAASQSRSPPVSSGSPPPWSRSARNWPTTSRSPRSTSRPAR